MPYNLVECDKCFKKCEGYYILSHKTKGLWVKCPSCGTHPRPYISNLFLPYKPSNSYRSIHEIPIKRKVFAQKVSDIEQTSIL